MTIGYAKNPDGTLRRVVIDRLDDGSLCNRYGQPYERTERTVALRGWLFPLAQIYVADGTGEIMMDASKF